MNQFQIISGYTINTPYEKEVKNLKRSLENFGFSSEHIVGFESLGTWEKNCQQKALIIKSKLRELAVPVVWLDADAILRKNPILFSQIEKDIAFCYSKIAGKYELLSGTIFLKPTELNFKILDEWINLNNLDPNQWDQRNLQKIIKSWNIDYYNLPLSYCKIDYIKCTEVIISQNQASRRFKKLLKTI